MFDYMPEILGVMWPKPHRLWSKFCICLFAKI